LLRGFVLEAHKAGLGRNLVKELFDLAVNERLASSPPEARAKLMASLHRQVDGIFDTL